MKTDNKIGLYQLSEILNNYKVFIFIFTFFFSSIITINNYFHSINSYNFTFKILLNKEIKPDTIEKLIESKQIFIIDAYQGNFGNAQDLKKYMHILGNIYFQLGIIDEETLKKDFLIPEGSLFFEKIKHNYLKDTDISHFTNLFASRLNNKDKWYEVLKKYEIDKNLIDEIFKKFELSLTYQSLQSKFSINYKLDEDKIINLENGLNDIFQSIVNELNIIYYKNLSEELKYYNKFLEEKIQQGEVFTNKHLYNKQQLNKSIYQIYDSLQIGNRSYEIILMEVQPMIRSISEANRIIEEKLNNIKFIQSKTIEYLNKVNLDIEENKRVIDISLSIDISDNILRKNIYQDSIVVLLISLFFGYILSVFFSIILYIRSLSYIKN